MIQLNFIRMDNVKTNVVDHPDHYNNGNIECIDAMTSAFGIVVTQDFCKLNAFKYIWRSELKGNENQDIKKAIWYLNKFLELDSKR